MEDKKEIIILFRIIRISLKKIRFEVVEAKTTHNYGEFLRLNAPFQE